MQGNTDLWDRSLVIEPSKTKKNFIQKFFALKLYTYRIIIILRVQGVHFVRGCCFKGTVCAFFQVFFFNLMFAVHLKIKNISKSKTGSNIRVYHQFHRKFKFFALYFSNLIFFSFDCIKHMRACCKRYCRKWYSTFHTVSYIISYCHVIARLFANEKLMIYVDCVF